MCSSYGDFLGLVDIAQVCLVSSVNLWPLRKDLRKLFQAGMRGRLTAGNYGNAAREARTQRASDFIDTKGEEPRGWKESNCIGTKPWTDRDAL